MFHSPDGNARRLSRDKLAGRSRKSNTPASDIVSLEALAQNRRTRKSFHHIETNVVSLFKSNR